MEKQRVYVFNATDGVFASPHMMTVEQARQFIRDYVDRVKRTQGYYLTSRWERIAPEEVRLVLLDEDHKPVRG